MNDSMPLRLIWLPVGRADRTERTIRDWLDLPFSMPAGGIVQHRDGEVVSMSVFGVRRPDDPPTAERSGHVRPEDFDVVLRAIAEYQHDHGVRDLAELSGAEASRELD